MFSRSSRNMLSLLDTATPRSCFHAVAFVSSAFFKSFSSVSGGVEGWLPGKMARRGCMKRSTDLGQCD